MPRAVGLDEALRRLNIATPARNPAAEHPQVWVTARDIADRCPKRMGGGANTSLLFTMCEHLLATRVVETGVAYGWSSLALLLSLATRSGARLWSIDLPYFSMRNDRWVGCVVPDSLRTRWTVLHMADREGLPRALQEARQIDLAHYDSDKTPSGRLWAYTKMWEALRPGGMLISDDIGEDLGFRDFCEQESIEPLIIDDNGGRYQGLALRRS